MAKERVIKVPAAFWASLSRKERREFLQRFKSVKRKKASK